MKDKILFLIIGVLIGLCSFFFVRLCKTNSEVEEMNSLLRKNIKQTENEFVLLNRKFIRTDARVDEISDSVKDMKEEVLGETVKIGDKWYLRGGMYGKIRALHATVTEINEQLDSIQKGLGNNIGSNFSVTEISEKLDRIKNEIAEIKYSIGSEYGTTGIASKINDIDTNINQIKRDILFRLK